MTSILNFYEFGFKFDVSRAIRFNVMQGQVWGGKLSNVSDVSNLAIDNSSNLYIKYGNSRHTAKEYIQGVSGVGTNILCVTRLYMMTTKEHETQCLLCLQFGNIWSSFINISKRKQDRYRPRLIRINSKM